MTSTTRLELNETVFRSSQVKLLTHDLAGVSLAILGEKVCSMNARRDVIHRAMAFIFDGI